MSIDTGTQRTNHQLLTGWGRTAPSAARVLRPRTSDAVVEALLEAQPRGITPRGMGRSYGDPAQNAGGTVLDMAGLDQMWLDSTNGRLTAQAGVAIDEVLRRSVPHGWFVPVTAGTRFVSVGGAIAADIHGKNHHRDGTFGQHVESLDLVTANGQPGTYWADDQDPTARETFWATVGGMGQTGVVTSAQLQMLPIETSLITVDTDRFTGLDPLMERMRAADSQYRYTVAWLDSVNGSDDFRSVLTCGDHAPLEALSAKQSQDPLAYDPKVRVTAPPWFPRGALNRWSVAAFNEAWFRKAPQERRDELQTIADFFHPLDMVNDWNRIYGSGGFLQYQFCVPDSASHLIRHALKRLRTARAASFLTVFKRFGAESPAPLSFPQPGWTLTLDIPATVPGLGQVLDELDDQVVDAGGRLYLAKDSRMTPETFRRGYPRLDEWLQTVRRLDPQGVFTSDQFRRLLP